MSTNSDAATPNDGKITNALEIRRRRRRQRKTVPDFTYANPKTGKRVETRREIRSPLSGKVIIRLEDDGTTTRLPDGPCPSCVSFIEEKGRTHALDPIFFWGAGIFEYESMQTPLGRKAYLTDEAMGRFVRSLPYKLKKSWKKIVGLPFPYLFVKK